MKCLVGMSGGVDSSTCAALMKKKHGDVLGVTFKMFDSEKTEAFISDAKKVAEFLEIEHIVVDCRKEFKKYVTDNFVNAYKNGETPNPCVMCNKFVKFYWLDRLRKKYSADIMVTGHYARIIKFENRIELRQAKDISKDQSYFLYKIPGDILRFIEFPLGEFSKSETRKIAESFGLHVAHKSESQDICFIPNDDYISFVKRYLGDEMRSGNIVNERGEILGRHKGTINYTIGQRKGLGLSGGPFFVKEINPENNTVVVSDKNGVKVLRINLSDVNFLNGEYLGECQIKIRSANKKRKAKIIKNSDRYVVELFEDEYGVAKGQHCVFYLDDLLIGGGIII